jgi:hypothetical protein
LANSEALSCIGSEFSLLINNYVVNCFGISDHISDQTQAREQQLLASSLPWRLAMLQCLRPASKPASPGDAISKRWKQYSSQSAKFEFSPVPGH